MKLNNSLEHSLRNQKFLNYFGNTETLSPGIELIHFYISHNAKYSDLHKDDASNICFKCRTDFIYVAVKSTKIIP